MSNTLASSELYYEIYGTGNPILFLHGFGANTSSWRNMISPLAQHYKLIFIDLQGFGASPKPANRSYSLQDHVLSVYRFIQRHNLTKLTIVGHSLGGSIALLTALKLLEDHSSRLVSLVLICSVAYQQQLPIFIKILRTPIIGPLALCLLPSEQQVWIILKLAFYDDKKISDEMIKAYAAPLETPGAIHALLETAKQIIPPNIDEISGMYSKVKVPTLVIWGRHDKIVPLWVGERLCNEIPQAKLVIIESSGHIPHEESPEETISVLRAFLKAHHRT